MLIGKAVVRGVPMVHVHPPLGLKRPPDPSPNFAPPISNSWLRTWLEDIKTVPRISTAPPVLKFLDPPLERTTRLAVRFRIILYIYLSDKLFIF